MDDYRWNPFLRFPRTALAVVAFACLPLGWEAARFRVSTELRVLLAGDQRNLESYEKVQQVLRNQVVLVLSLALPDLFTREGLATVGRVSAAFAEEPGVTDVKSLTHSTMPVRRGWSFELVPFVPERPLTAEDLAQLRTFSLSHPLVRNLMVAEDGRHTIILVTYERLLETAAEQAVWREEVEEVLARFRAEGMRFEVLALPLVEEEVRASLRSDVVVMVPAALVLLAGVLWATFRSWRFLGLTLANQAVALLLLPGLIQLAGFSLSVFSVMLLPLLTGVHLTLLAHVHTSFQRALRISATAREAATRMLGEVFTSCAFAAITTVAGLSSLGLSEVRQVQEFGLLGAMGIGLIFLMTFGPGLSVLVWLAPRPAAAAESRERGGIRWAEALTGLVRRRARAIILAALLAAIIGGWGVTRLRTDIRAVEFLESESPTRQAVEALDRIYGGINVVQIEFDTGRTNGINHPGFLRYLEQVQDYVEGRPEVSGVYSYAQLMAMMNQIWEGGQTGELRVPDNPLLLSVFALALKAEEYPFITALADPSFRTAYLVLRTRDMPVDRYLGLLHAVVGYARQHRPELVQVSAAAGIHSILEADRRIVRSQVHTAGFTVAVIGLVLVGLWRSPRLAGVALVSNVVPVTLVMGCAGFADVPLNSITVMVAAIALGIAVDDAVHFVTHWRAERQAGAGPADALARTFRVKGRPIIATSSALIAIFALFAFASFPPVAHFGVLCALAFAAALLAVMLLLPALLLLQKGDCARRTWSVRGWRWGGSGVPGPK